MIILSQNCTDIAALRAYRNLDQEIGVTPLTLGQTETRKIAKAIRFAGLHKQKAKSLRKLGKIIAGNYSGTLSGTLQNPLEEARALLQELPNVGPKTADVLLALWGNPTISVDTHVDRVSKRLGLAQQKANYENVRTSLMQLYNPKDYRAVPLLFMALGRKICKAPVPRCFQCQVANLCPFPNKTLLGSRTAINMASLGKSRRAIHRRSRSRTKRSRSGVSRTA